MRFARVDGADHFLNDGPTEVLLDALEACVPRRRPWRLALPTFTPRDWPLRRWGEALVRRASVPALLPPGRVNPLDA